MVQNKFQQTLGTKSAVRTNEEVCVTYGISPMMRPP